MPWKVFAHRVAVVGGRSERRQREVLDVLLEMLGEQKKEEDEEFACKTAEDAQPVLTGEHELQIALAECSHLVSALGAAAAPQAEALERCVLRLSAHASYGVRAEAATAGAVAGQRVATRRWMFQFYARFFLRVVDRRRAFSRERLEIVRGPISRERERERESVLESVYFDLCSLYFCVK